MQEHLEPEEEKMPIILFTEKKSSTYNPDINSHTNRCIAQGRTKDALDHVRLVQNTKHLAQIMIFGLVSINGLKLGPVYVPIRLRMGVKEYLELILEAHVFPGSRLTSMTQGMWS